ncbi:RRM domain-containing protein, partial [Haematococcus lacustris]
MPSIAPDLHADLSTSSLLIFKGDLNYRKLVSDSRWAPTTPFRQALLGFLPAPLLTLRTCKADVVTGLLPG